MGIRRYNLNSSSPIKITINKSDEVYVDSSFLLSCFLDPSSLGSSAGAQRYKMAKAILHGFLQKKVRIVISSLAFDEVWYIYLKLLYERDHGRGTWTKDTLKKNPRIITIYKDNLKKLQRSILAHPYHRVVGISEDVVGSAFDSMIAFQLGPRDSFHFAVCCYEKAECLISRDRDFAGIPADCKGVNLNVITF